MTIQRQFNRHGKFSWQGEDKDKPTSVLDTFNESLVSGDRFLHATKGYRTYRVKRGKAQMIMAEIKVGKFPLPIYSFIAIRQILTDERAG